MYRITYATINSSTLCPDSRTTTAISRMWSLEHETFFACYSTIGCKCNLSWTRTIFGQNFSICNLLQRPVTILSAKADTVTCEIETDSASYTTSGMDNVTARACFHQISVFRKSQFGACYNCERIKKISYQSLKYKIIFEILI